MTKRPILAALAAAALWAVGAQAADMPKELNFGIISTDSTIYLKEKWTPFLDDMSKTLGLKVNAFFAPDYAGVIEAMRFGKVDVAWYGNKSAIEAVDRANGEVFVQTVDANGDPGYWSLLITHRDSGIQTLDDVLKNPGKYTFGNGDPNSTSGFLVPGYYVFARNGIDPKKHFTVVRNANHETNAMAVINRQVDLATNNTEELQRIKDRFPDKYSQIRVIWKSPLIPKDPIVWRKDLPDELKAKVKAFFLEYGVKGPNVEQEKQVLAGLKWAPFRESSNRQLLPIRQLGLFKDRIKVEGDQTLGASEKKAKLGDIDAKLEAIQKELGLPEKTASR